MGLSSMNKPSSYLASLQSRHLYRTRSVNDGIIDGRVENAVLLELLTDEGVGTLITAEETGDAGS